ncbi:hypothetical protein D3C85_1328960 [compost metagenome]
MKVDGGELPIAFHAVCSQSSFECHGIQRRRHTGDRRRKIDICDRYAPSERGFDAFDHACHQNGVTAQLEKIIRNADILEVEQLAPDLLNLGLGVTPGGDPLVGRLQPQGLGQEAFPVPLTVVGEGNAIDPVILRR